MRRPPRPPTPTPPLPSSQQQCGPLITQKVFQAATASIRLSWGLPDGGAEFQQQQLRPFWCLIFLFVFIYLIIGPLYLYIYLGFIRTTPHFCGQITFFTISVCSFDSRPVILRSALSYFSSSLGGRRSNKAIGELLELHARGDHISVAPASL